VRSVGLLSEPLAKQDQGLGQWRACNETFGCLSKQGLKGGLKIPTETTHRFRVFLVSVSAQRDERSRSCAGVHGGFEPTNHAFLLVSDGTG
jgi:hypothetical protein